mgnify:CR=1 FL=1
MSKTYYRWTGHAEEVFYNYRSSRREMRNYIEGAMFGGRGFDGMPSSGRISDPTANTAVGLLATPRYKELQRQVKAVQKVLEALPEQQRALIRRVYIDHRSTLQGAAAYLGVSYMTVRRWKQKACLALARELGWIGESNRKSPR